MVAIVIIIKFSTKQERGVMNKRVTINLPGTFESDSSSESSVSSSLERFLPGNLRMDGQLN